MNLDRFERNLLNLADTRSGMLTDAMVRDLADTESRAEIGLAQGDENWIRRPAGELLALDPALVEQRREQYTTALSSLVSRGALAANAGVYMARAELLDEVALETIGLNMGLKKSHRKVREARAEQLAQRAVKGS